MSTLNELYNQLTAKGYGVQEAKNLIESACTDIMDILSIQYPNLDCNELVVDTVVQDAVQLATAEALTADKLMFRSEVQILRNGLPLGIYRVQGIYPQTKQIRFERDGSQAIVVNYEEDSQSEFIPIDVPIDTIKCLEYESSN